MIALLIVALSLAGLVISIYFTFAYYGRVKKSRWVPEILCAREGSSCVTVVQTPYARVFGVPNSLLGIVYYLAVLVWVFDDIEGWSFPIWTSIAGGFIGSIEVGMGAMELHFSGPVHLLLVLASLGTVVLGFYLIYALRRLLQTDCPLCFTAHAINLAIFVLLFLSAG